MIAPTRKADWPVVLAAFISDNRNRPFRWGSWDCCLFACNAIREITGVDVATKYRGKYQNMLGAMRIARGTVRNVALQVAARYGFDKYEDPKLARPGDIVLAPLNGTEMLGVVSMARTAIFATTTGLAMYPLSLAKDAWKIG